MHCACSGGQDHWWHFSGLSWLLRGLTPTPTKAVPSWANFGPKALCYTLRVFQLCLEILWLLLFNSIQIQWKYANKCLLPILSDSVGVKVKYIFHSLFLVQMHLCKWYQKSFHSDSTSRDKTRNFISAASLLVCPHKLLSWGELRGVWSVLAPSGAIMRRKGGAQMARWGGGAP